MLDLTFNPQFNVDTICKYTLNPFRRDLHLKKWTLDRSSCRKTRLARHTRVGDSFGTTVEIRPLTLDPSTPPFFLV